MSEEHYQHPPQAMGHQPVNEEVRLSEAFTIGGGRESMQSFAPRAPSAQFDAFTDRPRSAKPHHSLDYNWSRKKKGKMNTFLPLLNCKVNLRADSAFRVN